MAKLLALYQRPGNTERFDEYYKHTHTPLAKKIPGLKAFDVSQGPIATPQGPAAYYQVATLVFDSLEALQAGLASPEGQRVAADIANFADGGAEILIFDDHAA